MPGRHVTTTAAAEKDIQDIARYIASDNPPAARRFSEEIWTALAHLSDMPDAGFPVTNLSAPLRVVRVSARFRRYLIFYRLVDEANVEIVRVLHGARDITRLMRELP